ncbi:outer membrane biosynthesis protein TonB [Nocardia transvalensis]|uniref:Outer membrane biosynthesis protein TonB n=1 Tax=Nocardia transvalensis TaxID=37333 RepID=A0A7W9UIE3_9NOCA|nr:hypothetical protein [Nocardia transvalensis]MBB5914102.1 outer membrane biosynthesis protein TonB [Nocardia transvalensis]
MATGVGLRIAEDECVAAIVAGAGETAEDTPEPHYIVRESVLHMSDDGDASLGGDPPTGHSHSIRGFFAAVGNPAGISVDAGEAYRAEDLVATALFCLINLAADHLSGPAEFYATHPADWPAQQVSALRDALDYLGLRSVALVSEGDLPAPEHKPTGAIDGRSYARDAARAALAAVLATPAGTTPPDPTHAENALIVTDVLPALQDDDATRQAYSAAMPAAYSAAIPAAAEPPPAEPPATAEAEKPAPPPPPAEPRRLRRTPLLIAAAGVLGLIFGGVVVALLLRDDTSTPVPPLPNARSEPAPTSAAPPPPPVFVAPAPTVAVTPEPEPETTEPPPPPPPTSEAPPPPPPTTTTTPHRTTRPTPTPHRTTTPPLFPSLPFPTWIPTQPGPYY